MNTTNSNILDNIEASISVDAFLGNLTGQKQNAQLLMQKTLARIHKSFFEALSIEQFPTANYLEAIELVNEAIMYGFIKEAHTMMTGMFNQIQELDPEWMPWWTLNARLLNDYVIPNGYEKPKKSKRAKDKIFLENYIISGDRRLITVCYCFKRTMDEGDPIWYDKIFLVQDLVDFIDRKYGNTCIDDRRDESGEHVQTLSKVDLYTTALENAQRYITEYIEAGEELVSL